MFVEWIKTGKPTVLGAISGAVAGLVVITPASGFTTIMYAIIMGFVGGVICFFSATTLKHMLGYDDSLDAFGVHGVGGTIGAIMTGIFATRLINPLFDADGKQVPLGIVDGNHSQIINQLAATGLTWVLAAVGSVILLSIIKAIMGLRVSEADEYDGLDLTQHGESGYNFEESFPGTVLDDVDNGRRAVSAH
jgi:Amt family ammonium transporter